VFVIFGEWDYSTKLCTYRAYGEYEAPDVSVVDAAKTILPWVGPVLGEIADETLKGVYEGVWSVPSIRDHLIIEVPDWQYYLADNVRAGMSQTPVGYKLLTNDCVSFVQKIATVLGMDVPDRGLLLPGAYLAKLKETALRTQTTSYFKGQMISGLPAGFGTDTYPDGSTYTGTNAGGGPYGTGTFRTKNVTYTGDFDKHGPYGHGLYTATDGATYERNSESPDGSESGKYTFSFSQRVVRRHVA